MCFHEINFSFLFQVLMKDVATPVPQNEVRAVIKKSLENAALVNYERLSEEARIEGTFHISKWKKKYRVGTITYFFLFSAEMKNKQGRFLALKSAQVFQGLK